MALQASQVPSASVPGTLIHLIFLTPLDQDRERGDSFSGETPVVDDGRRLTSCRMP